MLRAPYVTLQHIRSSCKEVRHVFVFFFPEDDHSTAVKTCLRFIANGHLHPLQVKTGWSIEH